MRMFKYVDYMCGELWVDEYENAFILCNALDQICDGM